MFEVKYTKSDPTNMPAQPFWDRVSDDLTMSAVTAIALELKCMLDNIVSYSEDARRALVEPPGGVVGGVKRMALNFCKDIVTNSPRTADHFAQIIMDTRTRAILPFNVLVWSYDNFADFRKDKEMERRLVSTLERWHDVQIHVRAKYSNQIAQNLIESVANLIYFEVLRDNVM